MIFFLRMPTGAIYINHCEDDNKSTVIEKFRKKYEPKFISKIAEMVGGSSEFNSLCRRFSKFKVSTKSHQYMPANELIDFINTQHVLHKQAYHDNYESVGPCNPDDGCENVSISMTLKMQNDLLIEGARQSVNPCELVREVVMFYLAIRSAIALGEDPEPRISAYMEYLRTK